MRHPFICTYCQTLVTPKNSHHACYKTCGSPECQAKLYADHRKKSDYLRQRQKIQELKKQGLDLVTCQICQEEFEMIHHSHLKKHGLTVSEYKTRFPKSEILNDRIRNIKSKTASKRSKYLSYNGKNVDKKLYEFMAGTLLGDGSIERRSVKRNARYAEGGNNKAYLTWKKCFLEEYFSCSFQERLSRPHPKTGKRYKGWWIKTTVHPELSNLHSLWYSDKKKIPKDFIENYLTEFAFSIWFYDDGCMSSGSFLYTLNFSEDEVCFLSRLINEKFRLKNSVLKNKQNQYFIRISNYSKSTLSSILNRHPIPGMEYKRDFNLKMISRTQ